MLNDEVSLIKKYVPLNKQTRALSRLKKGEPVQYIIGNVEFFNSIINVEKGVLIPRFETEFLIEETLKKIKELNLDVSKILEIGTGTGCISIALKKELNVDILAIDISKKAINLAKNNAIKNNVDINFLNCDVCTFETTETFDLIISNPPYVSKEKEINSYAKKEPKRAIFAKNNGLFFYDVILKNLKNNLNENYLIAFEIDDGQAESINKLVKEYLPSAFTTIKKDYNNYERYFFITNKLLKC